MISPSKIGPGIQAITWTIIHPVPWRQLYYKEYWIGHKKDKKVTSRQQKGVQVVWHILGIFFTNNH